MKRKRNPEIKNEPCSDESDEKEIPSKNLNTETSSSEDEKDNKQKPRKKNSCSKEEKQFKSNNLKCGEVYWSKEKKRYIYICTMCPTEKFNGCHAFSRHYTIWHPSFDLIEKDPLAIIDKNDSKNMAWKKISQSGLEFQEMEKQIALEQLRALTRQKRFNTTLCYKCRKEFKTEKELVEHVKIHSSRNPLVCVYCERQFLKLEDLKHHQLEHSERKPFLCKFCDQTFRSFRIKQEHLCKKAKKKNDIAL